MVLRVSKRVAATLTGACSVGHHDSLVFALRTRQSVLRLAALEAVARTGTAVAQVQHVLVAARLAPHRWNSVARIGTHGAVERTFCHITRPQAAPRSSETQCPTTSNVTDERKTAV